MGRLESRAMENKISPPGISLPLISRLPSELRLKIYRLLLLSDQTVRMVWLKDNQSFPCPNSLFLAILRIYYLIYNEATGVLYGENQINVDPNADVRASSLRLSAIINTLS